MTWQPTHEMQCDAHAMRRGPAIRSHAPTPQHVTPAAFTPQTPPQTPAASTRRVPADVTEVTAHCCTHRMDGVRHWGLCTEDSSQCTENCPVSDSPCISGFAPTQPAGERANCVFEGGVPLINAPRGFWNRTRLARLELHTCRL